MLEAILDPTSKIDAKIDVEQVLKNDAKNSPEMMDTFVQTRWEIIEIEAIP